jgi:hypothetical protein
MERAGYSTERLSLLFKICRDTLFYSHGLLSTWRWRMKIREFAILQCVAMCMVLHLIPVSYGNATSVSEVSMNDMLRNSQFVFEGKVTAIETKENSQRRIHTYVTFDIKYVIKGEYQGNQITLRFLGGKVGDVTLSVGDMRLPQEREHGIYFLESLERLQVNPLYGWSQGHFIVEQDVKGIDRVMTNKRLPVTGLMDDLPDRQTMMGNGNIQILSRGVVRDLVVAKDGKDIRGLTVDEFKMVLHQRMKRIQ